ncbi:MAG: L-serine ammonia-lyase, iron-sulfur-dependent, subunit alpha [Spirochaeta sp.]|nr:L-serine ammonia-lyase, iron-sulfur-dependent, subunit alpha [Spirochaeta sp.]
MFKIGVGPSSSHTMGPWKAALLFVNELPQIVTGASGITRLQVELFGSLAKTGPGHGTDLAVMLGLAGYDPATVPLDVVQHYAADRSQSVVVKLKQSWESGAAGSTPTSEQAALEFHPTRDIHFLREKILAYHPNGMRFSAFNNAANSVEKAPTNCSQAILTRTYFSIGGGFVVDEADAVNEAETTAASPPSLSGTMTHSVDDFPYPYRRADELKHHCHALHEPISGVALRNELRLRSIPEIEQQLDQIVVKMCACVVSGLSASGDLPGGLNVQRRAPGIAATLLGSPLCYLIPLPDPESEPELPEVLADVIRTIERRSVSVGTDRVGFERILRWISAFALAANEENAAFGRVVTAPTNGAAGVIPAVMLYYLCFTEGIGRPELRRFLLTAGAIGSLFKQGATISAAMGGCQAEIGVSAAMAAAALAELQGADIDQTLMAAEIAMEHHLGLTCDPVGGLVQIPCIERNTMGAAKAIAAAALAISSDPAAARVSLDAVISTMWATAQDMNTKYKETSEGGLAVHIPINVIEC